MTEPELVETPRFRRGPWRRSWVLVGGPSDLILQRQIRGYTRRFENHRMLRGGRHIEYAYDKTRTAARWHLVNGQGRCLPTCHQPEYPACGFVRLVDAKALLVRLVG